MPPSASEPIGEAMNLIQNLQRTLEDAYEKAQLADRLAIQLETELKEAKQRNLDLGNALCRCRDMIEGLMKAGSPNQLEHDAKIYLGILEGLITNEVIKPYPDYATGPAAARKREKLMKEIRAALGEKE